METTLHPSQSSAVDNHMNHFLVSSAHWTADFLAQPPENFHVSVGSQGSTRTESNGRSFITEVSESEESNDGNSDGDNGTKSFNNDTKDQAKGRRFYTNIKEFRQGRLDHIFWGRPAPNETPRRSFWPRMDWSKEFENKTDNKGPGAETHCHGNEKFIENFQQENQPNGTYVATADDNGNVKTSMSWRLNMRKEPSKL